MGQPRPKSLDQRNRDAAAEAGRQAQHEMTGVAVFLLFEFLAGAPDLHQDPARVLEQARAGIGEHHAASVAVEQVLSQLDFQLSNLAAQGRLYHG